MSTHIKVDKLLTHYVSSVDSLGELTINLFIKKPSDTLFDRIL
jgi:hypothetical protein